MATDVKEKERVNGSEPDKTHSAAKEDRTVTGLTFDLSKITVGEIDDLNTAVIGGALGETCKLLAKFATAAPEAWGDPNDPVTYRGLLWPDFSAARMTLMNAVQEHVKNSVSGY